MKNGFDLWKSDSPVVPFFKQETPALGEAKGLPAGWVSQWGDKRAQKQADGSWAYVPVGTPLGMQPFFKVSVHTAPTFVAGSFQPTSDDELIAYLKSINFDDPELQKTLMNSPKFVSDMLKKFGTGFFDKFKASAGKVPTVPTAAPAASAATNPVDAALNQLGFKADSKQAFVLDQLYKSGSQDSAVNAYSKKYGVKYAAAFHEVEALVKQAASKGVISTSGDWDELKVSFNIGTGPVISAPAIAVSPSVSGGVDTEEPPKPKKGKKATPPAPPASPPPEPVAAPPKFLDFTDPAVVFSPANKQKYDDAVAKLDFPAGSIGLFLSNLLFTKNGDEESVAQGLHGIYPEISKAAAEKLTSAAKKIVLSAFSGAMAKTAFAQADAQTGEDLYLPVTTNKFGTKKKLSPELVALDSAAVIAALNSGDDAAVVNAVSAKMPGATPVNVAQFVGTLKKKVASTTANADSEVLKKWVKDQLVAYGVLPKPETPPPPTEKEVFSGGPKSVARVMRKLGYKAGTTGAQAIGLLVAHEGDAQKATEAFVNFNPTLTPDFAEKIVNAVRKEMLAYASGGPAPATDPTVAQALDKPPPEAPKASEPAPADQNIAATKDSTKKGVFLPDIPPMVAMSYAGDAKVKLGGNKPKKFLKDNGGSLFLHKYGADKIRAAGGEVAANLAAIVAGPGGFVPVKSVETDGDWGTVQPMVPNVVSDLSQLDLKKLTADQLRQLQRERVIDWVVSNHDSKAGNFIVTKDGNILGIDKEQAFKFIGKDSLSLDYSPNPSTPVYNQLYKAWADKEIELDPNDMLPFIQAVENTPDEDWKKAVQPYLDALSSDVREEVWDSILTRKKNVRKQFEKFFGTLKKMRGEGATFAFAGAAPKPSKAKKVTGIGMLVPPKVPGMAELTYKEKANIGGAGEKHFFTTADGKLWLLKVAAGKQSKKPEPWKVASQSLFATIGQAVKPSTPPVGPAQYNGLPATVQPWLGDGLTTLSAIDPSVLNDKQKLDVADEHVLDWLLSQHDTHGGNLVIVPSTGAVVGIDKEQGFKYLLPNPKWTHSTPEGDKLAIDYHPNAQYGESEPYYNKFWKAFADGKMDFEPKQLASAIAAVEAIPDDEYVKALEPYATAAYPTDALKASQLYSKALQRKQNLRKDFEAFITDLYQKRLKKKGVFSFAGGWVPEGASSAVVGAAAVKDLIGEPYGFVTPSGKQYPPLSNDLINVSPKVSDWATAAGFAPSSEEAKLLALWQSHGGDALPASVGAQADLVALGWDPADAKAAIAKISQAAAKTPGFNYSAFMADPVKKPKLVPYAPGVPVPGTPAAEPSAVPPAPKPALPPPPKELSSATVAEAGASIGVSPNSVYWSALDALAKYGQVQLAISALNGPSPAPEAASLNAKRVKYVHKKLKELGVVFAPIPTTTPSGTPPLAATTATATPSTALYAPSKPTAQGALGILNPAMVLPTGAEAPAPKSKKPPTPEGFPEPPEGQMWEVSTAAQFAQKHVYKVKPPKDASGNIDESSPNAVVKLVNLSLDGAKEYLQKLGVSPVQTLGKPLFKEKDGKVLVLVNKNEWEKAKAAKASEKFSQLVPIPPPEPPPGANDKFSATPKAGELKNPEAAPNLEALKTVHESKNIGYGAGFHIGGGAVETQSVSVQRRLTGDGKEYYRFNFKIREPYWKKFKGGTSEEWRYRRATYKDGQDAWQDGKLGDNSTDHISGGTAWESEGSKIWVGNNVSKYAYKGMVFADVYPKPGETPFDAFARTLDAMHPNFSKEVLKNPTKEEEATLALSALYWSVAPKEADKLSESDRNVPELKSRLQKLGYTEEDFANLSFEHVALDRVVPVLKGRHKKLKEKHNLQDITVGVSTPDRVALQLLSGTIGVVQRLQHGIACSESDNASPNADQTTGGGDYLYAGITKKGAGDGWSKWTYGQIQMVYDLSELDRLDIYQHASDQYGVCDPNQKGGAFKNRTTLEDNAGNCFEVCFRRGINARKILKVLCHNTSERAAVIEACKKKGITHVNGMAIEDLVVAKGSKNPNGFYSVHLEPAGY